MTDMDLDDLLDASAEAPKARPSRFEPKGSKFKPKSKAEAPPVAKKESDSIPLTKNEEPDTKPAFTQVTQSSKHEFPESDALDGKNMMVKPENGEEIKEEEKEAGDFMETDEAEDEVVREIDVFFNPSVDPSTQLYVLQYPLRPLWRPYELEERCEEVRVKPATTEVQVDLTVDMDSKNYNIDADPKVQVKKQTLTSSWKPPRTTGYAVGVLDGNKLHLNPIHAVVQLRPSMQHLKSKESKKKNVATSNVEESVKLEEPEEEKPLGTSKKQGKPLGASNGQAKDSAEDWVPLMYHGARSDIAARYLGKMVAEEGSTLQFSMSSSDYLSSLCPVTNDDKSKSKGPSRRFLLTLPLKERFENWLLQGSPVHRFDALKHLAPDESVEKVLGVLQELAQLIQGLWVPKSSLLYKQKDQELHTLAWDYVLLLFSRSLVVNNSQIPGQPRLAKAIKEALSILAVERPAFKDWKFKENPDTRFIKLYPDIVEKQERHLRGLEKHITEFVFQGKQRSDVKNVSVSNMRKDTSTAKSSSNLPSRATSGAASGMQMPEENRDALRKAIQKLFQTQKVCSTQQISQRLRDMAVSESARSTGFAREAVAAVKSMDAFPQELQSVINEVCTNVHGVYVLKSSPDNPKYNALRKIVIDLFIAGGPNAKLKKASIIEAARMELKRDIEPNEYQKVLQELCVSQGAAWVLRSGEGSHK